MEKTIRYEIEVIDKDGKSAKGYLAPLRFLVCEAALGYAMLPKPKMISAGEILINSLWVKGSPRLQEKGDLYLDACIRASNIVRLLGASRPDPEKEVYVLKRNKATFKCDLSNPIDRDTLEDAIGLSAPNEGNPLLLSAGKAIVEHCWVSGDKEIGERVEGGRFKVNDEELFTNLCYSAYSKIEVRQSGLKKV